MRARTVVIALVSPAVGAVAGSLAVRGVWWPLAVLGAAWTVALWRMRWLDRDIRRLDAEIAKEAQNPATSGLGGAERGSRA